MTDSIKTIADLSKAGRVGCNVPLIDKSDLIIREIPIRSAHMSAYYGERRPDVADHINSMKVTSTVATEGVLYIVMDDIVSSGNSLWACYNLLRMKGVKKENIKFLTIGRTL